MLKARNRYAVKIVISDGNDNYNVDVSWSEKIKSFHNLKLPREGVLYTVHTYVHIKVYTYRYVYIVAFNNYIQGKY